MAAAQRDGLARPADGARRLVFRLVFVQAVLAGQFLSGNAALLSAHRAIDVA